MCSRIVIPERRALLLLLLPALFLAASDAVPGLLYVFLVFLGVAIALIATDLVVSPRCSDFDVARVHDARLSMWVSNPIEIVVHNRASRATDVRVRDELPASFAFEGESRIMRAHLEPGEEVALAYHVRPSRRGDYVFGDLHMRWPSLLGLFVFQMTCLKGEPVKVYPNLLGVREYELLVRRGQAGQLGLRLSQQFGEGNEFAQLRDYLPDDDYRRIDWKATARHGRPITAEFNIERDQNILFLIDVGRQMMTRGSVGMRPWLDYAVDAVLLFSHVATNNGDRVGLLTFSDEVLYYLSPRPGRSQFYRIAEALYGVEAQPVEADYARALRYLRSKRSRRSLIVMFTNPAGRAAAQTLVAHLGAFSPQHLALCVLFSDPGLREATRRMPTTVRAAYERAIAQQFLEEREAFLEMLSRRGVLTLDVPADRLVAAVINEYLQIKGQSRV